MQRFRSWLNKITSTYLSDIFSTLVVTQEKLDVLRREIAVQINKQVKSNFSNCVLL